jgi:hypothetical protein
LRNQPETLLHCGIKIGGGATKQRTILFQHIPIYVYQIVSREPGLSQNQKLTLYVSLPWKLPPGDADREELEKQFLNHSRKLL